MKLLLITDAWSPQINGVVTTLQKTIDIMESWGIEVINVNPTLFKTMPYPGYKEIDVAINPWSFSKIVDQYDFDCIHICTESVLGLTAKLWCDRRGLNYTTSYHTKFPEYIRDHFGFGEDAAYRYMKYFHSKSCGVFVNTPTMYDLLTERGFKNLVMWGRGVDTDLFTPVGSKNALMGVASYPVWLNVGRVSVEKNLESFYELDVPGTKFQVGSGPMLEEYREKYPDVNFLGPLKGTELAAAYRAATYFVFPSKTDTFGLVMLESIACGVPVLGYTVTGPKDVIVDGVSGILAGEDLQDGANRIMTHWSKSLIREEALKHSWEHHTKIFVDNLVLK